MSGAGKKNKKQHSEDVQVQVRVIEDAETNPFGGLNRGELQSFADGYDCADPELDASGTDIAIESVAQAIAARIDNAVSASDPKHLAIFVVTDRPRVLASKLAAQPEPILNNGSQALCGRLWVVGPTCASGFYISLNGANNGEIFQNVIDQGLGNTSTLVFDPNATDHELRYYRQGLEEPDVVQRFLIGETIFSLEKLDEVITRAHQEAIQTPDAAQGSQIWNNPKKYIPGPKTEATLQHLLKLALSVAFHHKQFQVEWEVPGTEGRCDLMIVARDPSSPGLWIRHAVMELKVLRSFTSGGTAVSESVRQSAVKDGFAQIIAYRGRHNAKNGLLCCFDMRTVDHCDGDKCFDSICKSANKKAILLRRYRLYGSSKELRAEKYPC